jgi:hypothetical protein
LQLFLTNPFAYLMAFALVAATFLCALGGAQTASGAGAEVILGLAWRVMFSTWVDVDAGRRRCKPCFEFGFLTAVFFPASLLWYCVWSRGWRRGLLMVLALFALWVLPQIVATVFLDLRLIAL